jgi:hypothetical protein
MKRFLRWMLHLLTLLSLLLCLATVSTWIRSYFAFSELFQARHCRMVDQKNLRYSIYMLYLSKGAFEYGNAWYDISDVPLIQSLLPTGTSSWQFSHSDDGGVLYISAPAGSIAGIAIAFTLPSPIRGQVAQVDARLPYWVLFATFSFLPIIWIGRFIRQRARDQLKAGGCCLRCGYDLRATPDKCPECGNIPTKTKAISI